MKEVKSPKKPMAFYYIVVLALILLFNEMARPYMEQAQIVPVDYSTFMQSIDDKTVDHVESSRTRSSTRSRTITRSTRRAS